MNPALPGHIAGLFLIAMGVATLIVSLRASKQFIRLMGGLGVALLIMLGTIWLQAILKEAHNQRILANTVTFDPIQVAEAAAFHYRQRAILIGYALVGLLLAFLSIFCYRSPLPPLQRCAKMKHWRKTVSVFAVLFLLTIVAEMIHTAVLWNRRDNGYEVDPDGGGTYLRETVSEDVGYQQFKAEWVQRVWTFGIRDSTNLYVLTGNSDELQSFWQEIEKRSDVERGGNFEDWNYLGHATAPSWWNVDQIEAAHSVFISSRDAQRLWRFTKIGDKIFVVLSTS